MRPVELELAILIKSEDLLDERPNLMSSWLLKEIIYLGENYIKCDK